jgi:hypothetical protein
MTTPNAKNKTVSLHIPEPLLEMAIMVSGEPGTGKSKLLVEWLHRGAEEAVIELLGQGKISKGYAVKVLGTTYHELNEMPEARGIRPGPSNEQVKESGESARLLRP